jgi:uracil-DNA glycosylase family 4
MTSAKIEPEWVSNCGSNFLRQQIEVVQPKVVVGLGAFAFHAVLRAFGHPVTELRNAIKDTQGVEILNGVRLFAAYHCGKGTVNRNRDLKHQSMVGRESRGSCGQSQNDGQNAEPELPIAVFDMDTRSRRPG